MIAEYSSLVVQTRASQIQYGGRPPSWKNRQEKGASHTKWHLDRINVICAIIQRLFGQNKL